MTSTTSSDTLEPFLVIGAGQMRTGALSLHLALETLLSGKCYHMAYVMKNPEDVNFWWHALSTDPSDDEWKHFFRNYRAAVDYPAAAFYKRIMEVYPKAKIVLTVRDPHDWFKSVNNTIKQSLGRRKDKKVTGPMEHFYEMVISVITRSIGTTDFENEELMVEAFQRYTEEVKKHVPSENLLIFEAVEGWPRLCEFLGVPVPNIPYPNVNSSEEFRSKFVNEKE